MPNVLPLAGGLFDILVVSECVDVCFDIEFGVLATLANIAADAFSFQVVIPVKDLRRYLA